MQQTIRPKCAPAADRRDPGSRVPRPGLRTRPAAVVFARWPRASTPRPPASSSAPAAAGVAWPSSRSGAATRSATSAPAPTVPVRKRFDSQPSPARRVTDDHFDHERNRRTLHLHERDRPLPGLPGVEGGREGGPTRRRELPAASLTTRPAKPPAVEPPTGDAERWLTPTQAAAMLAVGLRTLWRLAAAGGTVPAPTASPPSSSGGTT